MIIHLQKYNALQLVISILYVKFFLISPFFHHHYEEEVANFESVIFHSHMFNQYSDNQNSNNPSQYTIEEENHYHLVPLNLTGFISPLRTQQLIQFYDFYSIQIYPQDISEKEIIKPVSSNLIIQLQWEKYVHSATNVSPPLA
jgi:hypothetical protein